MPGYDQLDDEAAWRAEAAAPGLARLTSGLQAHWPGAQIGLRGNNVHLNGYHRSRRWIKESRHCTNRTYSVSRTAGDKSGGNDNWVCALDFGGIPQAELHAVCRRLDVAVRAGRLEKITEWYGNFGGDQRVDGWDNISDRLASSDSSHLTHLHMSFDRGRANEDHSDVLAILIGQGGDDMFCSYGDKGDKVKAMQLQLKQVRPDLLAQHGADGDYGQETADAVSSALTGGYGRVYGPQEFALLQQMVAVKFGAVQ
jgi:hypothetical protein